MSEQEYQELLAQLAQEDPNNGAHCVSCWYEQHEGEAFPALDSSSLCDDHAQATWDAYQRSKEGRA